ncbi:MAG: hypothetical protein GC165_19015 [Armatimonadetes bacterium]|nr:hypothetical protein [Armatimonadota bacterium]MBS1727858.1 hypothetical protein [Armatimonadota bacterium]
MNNLVRLTSFAVLVCTLAACGGGGSAFVSARTVIAWPAQTREFSAPAYAGSATFTFTSDFSLTPVVWTLDRPATTDAQTIVYAGGSVPIGSAGLLEVVFKSGPSGTGATVATAAVNVYIDIDGTIQNSDGGALGTIAYNKTLTGLQVDAPDVVVGDTVPVVVTGVTPDGIVALPQGLIDLTVTSGSSFVTVSNNEETGVAAGAATIQASYEGFTASDGLTVSGS